MRFFRRILWAIAVAGFLASTAQAQAQEGACPNEKGWRPTEAQLQQIPKVRRDRFATKEWINPGATERFNFCNADLRGADLSWANLRWANLSDADVSGVDLRGVDLRGADLRGADLRWANLSSAILFDTDLRKAKLNSANLSLADLSRAKLIVSDAMFRDAQSLSTLRWDKLPHGIVEIRKGFKDAGERESERELTYAIKRNERINTGGVEGTFNYVLFEITSKYGLLPGRPLRILGILILVMAPLYWAALSIRRGAGGIWQVWPEDRTLKDQGSNEPVRLSDGEFDFIWLGV